MPNLLNNRTPKWSAKIKAFTLIELSVVLIIVGIIISSAQAFYRATIKTTNYIKIDSQLASINQSLITFALQNKRLPCADVDGNGYEGSGNGNCGSTALYQTGSVPYKTLEMNQMSNTQTQLMKRDIVYGVYRNPNVVVINDADLSRAIDRTSDSPGSQYYINNYDFIKALSNANAQPKSTSYVYTTGVGANENCTTTITRNYAYILASAGIEDADNNGNVYDGVNNNLKQDGTGSKCFVSSKRRMNNQYDDKVLVMNFQSLIGKMNSIN
jgi:prepilin-type N-terminal cleavage/methylation domain-containing protein